MDVSQEMRILKIECILYWRLTARGYHGWEHGFEKICDFLYRSTVFRQLIVINAQNRMQSSFKSDKSPCFFLFWLVWTCKYSFRACWFIFYAGWPLLSHFLREFTDTVFIFPDWITDLGLDLTIRYPTPVKNGVFWKPRSSNTCKPAKLKNDWSLELSKKVIQFLSND